MTFRKAFVVLPAGAVIAAAALAPVATSAHVVKKHHRRHHILAHKAGGNVNCSGIAPATVPYDLTVPPGQTCTINGSKIGHDVNVNAGATLIDNGGAIGHDVNGYSPKGMGIGSGGRIGGSINISGTSGAGPGILGNNYICNTTIAVDVSVLSSTSTAGQWIIGDNDEQCTGGGILVGNNLIVENNMNRVDISDNKQGGSSFMAGIGKNLTVLGNLVSAITPVVESNFVAGNATCQTGTTQDRDGTANIVNGTNNGCH